MSSIQGGGHVLHGSRLEGIHCTITLLFHQLAVISDRCMSYFGESDPGKSDFFVSQLSEVYAFGSNSSSQLAMRSSDKFHAATAMPHMDDAQMVRRH